MNTIKKLIFLINKPCVILITGKGRSCAAEAVFQVLKPHFKVKKISANTFPFSRSRNEILILETDLKNSKRFENFEFLIKKSQLPILVTTHIGDIPADRDFFSGEKRETSLIRKIAEILSFQGFLILNFDDETVREIKNETIAHSLTYGFQKGANFQATDINIDLKGTNFKMNYEGNIVPFWLKNLFGKEQIYSALSAVCVGVVKDINLVEIFQSLKSYQSLPGKMRLIKGIKRSFILDDTESATILSMIEALKILENIGKEKRKIAVLGDVLGIGKYTTEAHETIGEKVAKSADLLFAIGPRAKFIAQGARNKGMPEENIFEFDTIEQGKIQVQKEMKKDDVVLVDGSKEMNMKEVIEEIRNSEK